MSVNYTATVFGESVPFRYQPEDGVTFSQPTTEASPAQAVPAVEPVRIGINDRWVFVLRGPEPIPEYRLREMKDQLERWWASGEKFCVVAIAPGVEVSVQRVDD